ncbi:MAG TPA: hypothetical protein PKC91_13250 [Ignavibacteria bacterium]|nr:hypothetical protein [Ignavibacteria bacterium]
MDKANEINVILKQSIARKKHFTISYDIKTKDYNYTDNEFREEFIKYLLSIDCDGINSYTQSCIVFTSSREFSALVKLFHSQVFSSKIFYNLDECVTGKNFTSSNSSHEKIFGKLVRKLESII